MSVPTEALLQTFDLYDDSRTGRIPLSQIPHVLRSCAMFCTQGEMEELLRTHFLSADHVTRGEFQEFLRNDIKAENFYSKNDLVLALQAFDSRDIGALTSAEVQMILTTMNDRISVKEIRSVLAGLDADENGMFELNGLADHLLRPAKDYKLTAKQIVDEVME